MREWQTQSWVELAMVTTSRGFLKLGMSRSGPVAVSLETHRLIQSKSKSSCWQEQPRRQPSAQADLQRCVSPRASLGVQKDHSLDLIETMEPLTAKTR